MAATVQCRSHLQAHGSSQQHCQTTVLTVTPWPSGALAYRFGGLALLWLQVAQLLLFHVASGSGLSPRGKPVGEAVQRRVSSPLDGPNESVEAARVRQAVQGMA